MSKYCVQVAWEDVPHLTPEDIAELEAEIPPHLRDARTKGIPLMGAGVIYPISEKDILVEPFELPRWWPRAYALDVGWKRTAALWGAWDRDSDTVYLYSEYYAGQQPPAVHASAIAARGAWMTGAIDPASAGASQLDGKRLKAEYDALGLNLVFADNAVEAGILAIYQRLSRGGLKVFTTLRNWLAEYRIYRRDENGKIVKENDHLMDTSRYLIMTGMPHSGIEPDEVDEMEARRARESGRNEITGY